MKLSPIQDVDSAEIIQPITIQIPSFKTINYIKSVKLQI